VARIVLCFFLVRSAVFKKSRFESVCKILVKIQNAAFADLFAVFFLRRRTVLNQTLAFFYDLCYTVNGNQNKGANGNILCRRC